MAEVKGATKTVDKYLFDSFGLTTTGRHRAFVILKNNTTYIGNNI